MNGPRGLENCTVVEKWVKPSVETNAIIQGSSIHWEDVIPKEVGDFILENCANLTWSVKKTFTCPGYESAVGEVKFRGLTFESIGLENLNRRRRLLSHRFSGC